MQVTEPKPTEPVIPRIPIKIVRLGGKIKITVDKYTLELKELDDRSQTYDLISIEQFITKTATLLYNKIIAKDKAKQDFKQAFLQGAEDTNEQSLINMELKRREQSK